MINFLFYAPQEQIFDGMITLVDQEVHHLAHVLRFDIEDTIYVTNGQGSIFETTIVQKSKKQVLARITQEQFYPHEHLPTLAVGLLKNRTRLEWLIEKSVELGVGKLVFFQSERSERSKVNLQRLNTTAISAMKQSLRAWLPEMKTFAHFSDVLTFAGEVPVVLAHEKFDASSAPVAYDFAQPPLLLVGPEGGFSEDEIFSLLQRQNIHKEWLGKYRLRTETAALKLLSRYSKA